MKCLIKTYVFRPILSKRTFICFVAICDLENPLWGPHIYIHSDIRCVHISAHVHRALPGDTEFYLFILVVCQYHLKCIHIDTNISLLTKILYVIINYNIIGNDKYNIPRIKRIRIIFIFSNFLFVDITNNIRQERYIIIHSLRGYWDSRTKFYALTIPMETFHPLSFKLWCCNKGVYSKIQLSKVKP